MPATARTRRFARLSELGLRYAVGVTGSVTVWPPGRGPLPAPVCGGRRRVSTRLRLGGTALPQHHPQSVKALALELGPKHWHTVTWREGTNTGLRSRAGARSTPGQPVR